MAEGHIQLFLSLHCILTSLYISFFLFLPKALLSLLSLMSLAEAQVSTQGNTQEYVHGPYKRLQRGRGFTMTMTVGASCKIARPFYNFKRLVTADNGWSSSVLWVLPTAMHKYPPDDTTYSGISLPLATCHNSPSKKYLLLRHHWK